MPRASDSFGDSVFVLQAGEGSLDFTGEVEGEREPAFRQATPGLGPCGRRLGFVEGPAAWPEARLSPA